MFKDYIIETERLIIRPYKLEDVEGTYEVVSEEDFFKYIPEKVPSLEDVRKIIQWSMDCSAKNTQEKIYKFNNVIIHKEHNKIIGYCGLGPDDLDLEEVEVYYGLSKKYRGIGLASEATSAIIKYGFETIKLKKIIALVDYRNLPSIKLEEKMGMKYHFKIGELSKGLEDFNGHCYYSLSLEKYIDNTL